MPDITILPEHLANKIAAGEVVERPASVVKELIENAIDAAANRIDVEVEGGGTRLIRVIDDGNGMDEDDVLLCFERHGTSKISNDADLDTIETLGFRGEAIPSIASVSRMTIVSRPKNSSLGTLVYFNYGKLEKAHETGCSLGTRIEVRNLFGNTPARKKFLRTKRTEISHIDEIVKNYSLGCPSIAFSLTIDGRNTIAIHSGLSLEDRLRKFLNYNKELININVSTQRKKLSGFLVPPELKLSGSNRMRLFINGRAIKDRVMHHAVIEGLRGFLLKGHSPAGYLHLRIEPNDVDVNVHPAKHEVRFRDSRDVHQFIQQAIEHGMSDFQQHVREDFITRSSHTEKTDTSIRDAFSSPTIPSHHDRHPRPLPYPANTHHDFTLMRTNETQSKATYTGVTEIASETPIPPDIENPAENTTIQGEPAAHHTMQIIGQLNSLYIFCRSGDNLIVIDQHAAHERLLYEKYRNQYFEGKIASQTLLFPETIELTPFQIQLVESNSEEIEKLGFSFSEFGGNSYILSAIPAIAGIGGAKDIFLDVLNTFGSEPNKRTPGGKLDDLLASLACKAAIKAGQSLSEAEINGLLDRMVQADLFSHCPHGRPVVRKFTPDEIKKWFSRT